jgi:hypothetical protein
MYYVKQSRNVGYDDSALKGYVDNGTLITKDKCNMAHTNPAINRTAYHTTLHSIVSYLTVIVMPTLS